MNWDRIGTIGSYIYLATLFFMACAFEVFLFINVHWAVGIVVGILFIGLFCMLLELAF